MNDPLRKVSTLNEIARRILALSEEIKQEASRYTQETLPPELEDFARHLRVAGIATKNMLEMLRS